MIIRCAIRLPAAVSLAFFVVGSACAGEPEKKTESTLDKPPNADPVICRRLAPPTGTRLGARLVCQKKSEWEQWERDSQEDLDRTLKQGSFANRF